MFLSLFKLGSTRKKIETGIEKMTVGQLDANLPELYSKSILLGFRHSFERYLNAPPLNRGLKLSSDPCFKRSNDMLNAQIINSKRQGKENVKHKPTIEN